MIPFLFTTPSPFILQAQSTFSVHSSSGHEVFLGSKSSRITASGPAFVVSILCSLFLALFFSYDHPLRFSEGSNKTREVRVS